MTDDEFVAAIEAAPEDAALRAVYADWLEERSDPRAELVRIESDLWKRPIDLVRYRRLYPRRLELRGKLDPAWGARIARPSPAELLRRLAVLAELNPAREDGYEVNPPLTEQQVAAFEARHGLTLPAQYRRFLLEVGDGGAGPDHGLHPLGEATAVDVRQPFVRPASEDTNHQMAEHDGIIEISEIGCGSFYYLVVTGPDAGAVWVCGDHGWFPELATGSWNGLSHGEIIHTPRASHAELFDWYSLWLDEQLWLVCRNRPDGDEVFDRDPAEVPHLNLANRQLTALPEGLRKLTELVRLDIGNNPLAELPDWIGDFSKLEWLSVGGTTLKTLPASIAKLRSLAKLSLFMGRKLEQLPDSIGEMTWLQELDVRYNALTSLPDSIGNLTQLPELELHDNQLTTLPRAFGKLRQLKKLSLENNKLVTLPEEFSQLDQLEELTLGRNPTMTILPDCVAKLPSLKVLRFTYASTLDLADACRKLARVKTLRTLNLHLSGLTTLPDEIGLLVQLHRVDVSYNHLVDVPASFAKLESLREINLEGVDAWQDLWPRLVAMLPQLERKPRRG